MKLTLLRYYFFLNEDSDKAEKMINVLKSHNFDLPDTKSKNLPNDLSHMVCSFVESNIYVLVVALSVPSATWDENLLILSDYENQANLDNSSFLSTTTVLLGETVAWEQLLDYATGNLLKITPIETEIVSGKIARFGSKWFNNQAFYIISLAAINPDNIRFMLHFLPRFEANLYRLAQITQLYKDRNSTIIAELDNASSELSQILHSQLRNGERDKTELIDELEIQIKNLSTNYAILATDYNILAKDNQSLEILLTKVEQSLSNNGIIPDEKPFLGSVLLTAKSRLKDIESSLERVKIARENHQAAIEVVRSKIDIILSRENISTQGSIKSLLEINTAMQKQSLIFQVAAGIIEFIVLAYYSHSLWKNIAHISDYIPAWIQFVFTMLFSASIVKCTHLMAEYMQGDHHVRKQLYVYVIIFIVILLVILFGSTYIGNMIGH